jgi:hypothetical protein
MDKAFRISTTHRGLLMQEHRLIKMKSPMTSSKLREFKET